ncbi:MAG: phosphotransferase [Pseudonocardiaceae bacterium]
MSRATVEGLVLVSATQPSSTTPSALFDVREHQHEDALEHVEWVFRLRLDRSSVVYGSYGATEGFRTNSGTWVRVERRQRWRINSAVWVGLEAAATICGVRKPEWFQSTTWTDQSRDVVWRADEVEMIKSPIVGDLATAATLPDSWWAGLRASLKALRAHQTERVGMSQAHLSTRINEIFDGVDTTVDEWATAHTDVHWNNLTVDGHLIDWEDWGAAPRGHDAACLWQSALPDSQLTVRVQQEFAEDLQTRSGKLTQLLQCANAIRVANRCGQPTPLSEPAKAAANVLLAELTP